MIGQFFYGFCSWSDHTRLRTICEANSPFVCPTVEIFHLLG